ncbi:hypothetical protein ABLE91_07455 [Aquabacter sp. CN5-332]|uniref:hypothetical protein n=1 Tax=Aquabacter sp. CN5-332 TaxID=3156608 RepID=UPI0032B3F9CD
MAGFDIVSRLFALLLGLAIAEVLRGFARVLRIKTDVDDAERDTIRIGWLTPLLASLMIMDQTSFWFYFHEVGAIVPPNFGSLIGMMIVIGSYYTLSTLIFPSNPKQWPDFDDYYLKVKRTVIGGILAVGFASLAYAAVLMIIGAGQSVENEISRSTPVSGTLGILVIPVLIALLFIKSKRMNLMLLVLANVLVLGEALPF